ncbi:hypothetical protein [Desulfurococcus amylolyticus]|uniref:hypothetical protein n=1 Tax=Desulfurococcus amylolyticus TaxID=94694 RepID=UPI0023F2555C|nr:hypothetical protein [Desulfurococcus amylolyticus]
MVSTKISDKELDEALMEKQEKKPTDEKQRWVNRILRSAKQYHKICPYYDKRTKMCFLLMGTKCERDGKFDVCPVFKSFLEKKYDEYKSKNMPLPLDFADVVASPF